MNQERINSDISNGKVAGETIQNADPFRINVYSTKITAESTLNFLYDITNDIALLASPIGHVEPTPNASKPYFTVITETLKHFPSISFMVLQNMIKYTELK